MSHHPADPAARLALFYDGSEESREAKECLSKKGEPCAFYDVRDLPTAAGEPMRAPTLFAPEGIFQGLKQIRFFLGIPSQHRWYRTEQAV